VRPRQRQRTLGRSRRLVPGLVLMPFGTSYQEQLGSRTYFSRFIKPALREASVLAQRIDSDAKRDILPEELQERLRKDLIVVADVTGGNPNVMFELGFRRAWGGPVVCISTDKDNAPFWSKQWQIFDIRAHSDRAAFVRHIREQLDPAAHRRSAVEVTLLHGEVDKHRVTMSPLQDRMAEWRIQRAKDDVAKIMAGVWPFKPKTAEGYVAYVLSFAVSQLAEADVYQTVTHADFWLNRGVATSGFLRANVSAAQLGARIQRVFLLAEEHRAQAKDDRLVDLLDEHIRASKEGRRRGGRPIAVWCRFVKDVKASIRSSLGHFGLLLRPNEGFIVDLTYGAGQEPPDVTFTYSAGEACQRGPLANGRGSFAKALSHAERASAVLARWQAAAKRAAKPHS